LELFYGWHWIDVTPSHFLILHDGQGNVMYIVQISNRDMKIISPNRFTLKRKRKRGKKEEKRSP
jgi:hypothetical protein